MSLLTTIVIKCIIYFSFAVQFDAILKNHISMLNICTLKSNIIHPLHNNLNMTSAGGMWECWNHPCAVHPFTCVHGWFGWGESLKCWQTWQDVVCVSCRWVFIYEKGYQSTDTAVSSVFTKMKGVGYTNVNGSERVWDVSDYVFPPQVGVMLSWCHKINVCRVGEAMLWCFAFWRKDGHRSPWQRSRFNDIFKTSWFLYYATSNKWRHHVWNRHLILMTVWLCQLQGVSVLPKSHCTHPATNYWSNIFLCLPTVKSWWLLLSVGNKLKDTMTVVLWALRYGCGPFFLIHNGFSHSEHCWCYLIKRL